MSMIGKNSSEVKAETRQLLYELDAIHDILREALKTSGLMPAPLIETTVSLAVEAARFIKSRSFTDNELPQNSEQSVKEYKNRIYTVDYEVFDLKGSPVRQGTVEVLGEKTANAGALRVLVEKLYPTIFSGTSGVILQFNDSMFNSVDRGKRVLVISPEIGRD